jgi:hypothetical protein
MHILFAGDTHESTITSLKKCKRLASTISLDALQAKRWHSRAQERAIAGNFLKKMKASRDYNIARCITSEALA